MNKKNIYRVTMKDYNKALFQADDIFKLMEYFDETGDINVKDIIKVELVEED